MKLQQVLIAMTAGAAIAVLVGVASLSGISLAQADDDDAYPEQSRIRRGFEIAPVPLNLRHKDPELVGLGSYLVNTVGSCNMCHSGGTAITPRNLAPDKTGRPVGGRTFEEFRYIIRTGTDLDHALRHMTEHELRAIYEYLSAIPCVAAPTTGVLHNDCS
jgi:hypothetical protein